MCQLLSFEEHTEAGTKWSHTKVNEGCYQQDCKQEHWSQTQPFLASRVSVTVTSCQGTVRFDFGQSSLSQSVFIMTQGRVFRDLLIFGGNASNHKK